jgi:uncharacterized protein DUF4232
MMTTRHRVLAGLALACVLVGPAGCGGAKPAPTPSPQPSGSGPTVPPPSPVPSITAHLAGARCTTPQLGIAVAPGTNAAGHIGLRLVFTNSSPTPCTMSGYPGVSFVTGPSGTQIGDPAERMGTPGGPVTLAPQGRSHADLLLSQIGNLSAAACQPTLAAGLRVYPPDETTALYVDSARQVCAATGTGFAQIYPVQPGP